MRLIKGQSELNFSQTQDDGGTRCKARCTGQQGCTGPIYLAVDVADGPRLKVGWAHSLPQLRNRGRDHARAQLQIIWHATSTDDGSLLTWDDEQRIHRAIADVSPPYAGREYYLISQPVYSLIHRLLLSRCQDVPATSRALDRMQRMHENDIATTYYRWRSAS